MSYVQNSAKNENPAKKNYVFQAKQSHREAEKQN